MVSFSMSHFFQMDFPKDWSAQNTLQHVSHLDRSLEQPSIKSFNPINAIKLFMIRKTAWLDTIQRWTFLSEVLKPTISPEPFCSFNCLFYNLFWCYFVECTWCSSHTCISSHTWYIFRWVSSRFNMIGGGGAAS